MINGFQPLSISDREKLRAALKDNAEKDATILLDTRNTSFVGSTLNDISDEEVISAIRSVPCHY